MLTCPPPLETSVSKKWVKQEYVDERNYDDFVAEQTTTCTVSEMTRYLRDTLGHGVV